MAYVKKTWENKPSTASPINANNLNHMEQGIKDNDDHIEDVDLYLQTVAGEVNNLQSEKMNKANPTGTGYVQLGENASANSYYGTPTFAIGRNAKAIGYNSYAFGEGVEVIDGGQTAIGRYNDKTSGAQFMIGGGGDDDDRRNLLEFASNGDATFCSEVTDGTGNTLSAKTDTSDVADMIAAALPTDTESGNPCVITDGYSAPTKSLKLTLEPIQSGSGTPSPQNVRPISGRTQSVVTRTGKNLLNPSEIIKGYYDTTAMQIKSAGSEVYRGVKLYVAPGTYTISFSKFAFIIRLIADGVVKNNPASNVKTYTFTVTTTGYIAISWRDPNNTNWDDTAQVQLEVGSTATTYEAYNGESITRTYGTTIYGGVDDVTGSGVSVTQGYAVFGDFNWTTSTAGGNQVFKTTTPLPNVEILAVSRQTNALCSAYTLANTADNNTCFIYNADGCLYVRDDSYNDATTFQNNTSDVQICYSLATPTSIALTSQNIALLHGDNVLTTDANNIECEYSADIALYIAKKIAEGSQGNRSVNNSSLSKGGSSESTEEVKEEEKEEEVEIKETEPLTKEVR